MDNEYIIDDDFCNFIYKDQKVYISENNYFIYNSPIRTNDFDLINSKLDEIKKELNNTEIKKTKLESLDKFMNKYKNKIKDIDDLVYISGCKNHSIIYNKTKIYYRSFIMDNEIYIILADLLLPIINKSNIAREINKINEKYYKYCVDNDKVNTKRGIRLDGFKLYIKRKLKFEKRIFHKYYKFLNEKTEIIYFTQ